MAKGAAKSDDWECCEQCSFCFTIFVGILFFLAGGGMAVYSAIFLWGDLDLSIQGLEVLNTDSIQYGIFVVGLCIAGAALLGMITAGCAKCAANPDGKCDCCERCCTAVLSIIYIIFLSVLLAASLVIAGFLSYYASTLSTTGASECPYPSGSDVGFFDGGNVPDAFSCPFDYAMYNALYSSEDVLGDSWEVAQTASVTCGYYCDAAVREGVADMYYCAPGYMGSTYDAQTTGTFCSTGYTSDVTIPAETQYIGVNLAEVDNEAPGTGETTTMPFRPTLFYTLNTYLIPFLVVWWCIFVFALLLIIAACVMCIRKRKTRKEATYQKGGNNGN